MLKALSFAAVFLVRDLWSLQLFCGRPSTVPTDSTAAEFDFLLRNLAHSFCYFYDGGGSKIPVWPLFSTPLDLNRRRFETKNKIPENQISSVEFRLLRSVFPKFGELLFIIITIHWSY